MAKKDTRVTFNKNWAEELLQTPKLRAHLERLGEQGKGYAESISPEDTGDYKSKFVVDTQVIGDRPMTVLMNISDHGALVELHNHGSGDHVLSKTVDYLKGL